MIGQYEKQFPDRDFEERRKYMEKFMSSYGRSFEHCQHAGHGFAGHRHGHGQTGKGYLPFRRGGSGNNE